MKPILLRYLFFIFVPVVIAFSSGLLLQKGGAASGGLESATRLGNLAAALLQREISDMADQMAREAEPLENPDTSSPVVQAALAGDTVAALGTLSGNLVLSVAYAEAREEESPGDVGGPQRLRAMTEPFPASSISSLRERSGFGAALYFRGGRIAGLGGPDEFAPPTLTESESGTTGSRRTTIATSLGSAVLLPLDPDYPSSTPIHLLVTPANAGLSAPSALAGSLILLAGSGLGLAILLAGVGQRETGGDTRPGSLLALYLLPLGSLWIALALSFHDSGREARGFGQVEMVRALGLLRDAESEPTVGEMGGATGFDVSRFSEGRALESTLDDQLLIQELAELPPPPPSLPATGMLNDGPEALTYASMLEDSGTVLVLTGHGYERPLRFLRLLQAGLGGVASILGLVFVLSVARLHRGREEMRRGKSGAREP